MLKISNDNDLMRFTDLKKEMELFIAFEIGNKFDFGGIGKADKILWCYVFFGIITTNV